MKQVNDERLLNAYESIYIMNDSNALNKDNGNIDSYLFTIQRLLQWLSSEDELSRDAEDDSTWVEMHSGSIFLFFVSVK